MMTVSSFAITLCGVMLVKFIVVKVFVACVVLNLIMLICHYACSLPYLKCLFCFT